MEKESLKKSSEILTKNKIRIKKPRLYKVVMFNDNVTTMDFVVDILKTIFDKSEDEAFKMMMTIHTKGHETVGLYVYDIAVSKVNQVLERAAAFGFPLKCIVDEGRL